MMAGTGMRRGFWTDTSEDHKERYAVDARCFAGHPGVSDGSASGHGTPMLHL